MNEWKVLEAGEVFEERYRIESVLGVGGFAHVYRACQVDLDRQVALKILRPPPQTGAEDREQVRIWMERFRREAKVISKLRDPHTITMYDYGTTEAGMSYMVFEFVSGQSLDAILEERGALSPRQVVAILRQSLESIREAHSLGILHRDLKPANILLYEHMDRDDRVKVLDFGIAKPMREADAMTNADLTRDGSIVGTPRYMAPEQLKGEDVGPGSDLYSLGLVAYELLTGVKAVTGESTMTVISQQLSPDPIDLPASVDAPPGLCSIVNRMLVKAPERRYGDAAEVLTDLERWDAEELVAPLDATVAIDVVATADAQDASSHGPGPATVAADGASRRRNLIAATSAAAVVVVGGVVLFVLSGPGESESDDANTAEVEQQRQDDDGSAPPVEVAEETDDVPDDDDAVDETLEVVTDPEGAQVTVDGVEKGRSPLTLDVRRLDFPASIAARHDDGHRGKTTVEEPTPSVEMVLDSPPPPSGRPAAEPVGSTASAGTPSEPVSQPRPTDEEDEAPPQEPVDAPPEQPDDEGVSTSGIESEADGEDAPSTEETSQPSPGANPFPALD